ncbi:MAG: PqqD family protein [Deltaproteobacteria bacterium]|nr:PqqD family protein [Deltaproteobacteria bacterium]
MRPHARHAGLVVQQLADETLAYDLERHRAYCLNRTAALVWQHCDGRTTLTEMATLLEAAEQTPVDEEVIWLALEQLRRARLLQEPVPWPVAERRYSRREMMRKVSLVAGITVLLPLVSSIVAPVTAQATTCVKSSDCSHCIGVGLPCCTPHNTNCVRVTHGCSCA